MAGPFSMFNTECCHFAVDDWDFQLDSRHFSTWCFMGSSMAAPFKYTDVLDFVYELHPCRDRPNSYILLV
jgi:hypothetical protein